MSESCDTPCFDPTCPCCGAWQSLYDKLDEMYEIGLKYDWDAYRWELVGTSEDVLQDLFDLLKSMPYSGPKSS